MTRIYLCAVLGAGGPRPRCRRQGWTLLRPRGRLSSRPPPAPAAGGSLASLGSLAPGSITVASTVSITRCPPSAPACVHIPPFYDAAISNQGPPEGLHFNLVISAKTLSPPEQEVASSGQALQHWKEGMQFNLEHLEINFYYYYHHFGPLLSTRRWTPHNIIVIILPQI